MASKGYFKITDDKGKLEQLVLCISELCATAVLVFLGCMSCTDRLAPVGRVIDLHIALCFGIAVLIAVQIFGHISNAHMNPLVSVTAFLLGNLSLIQLPLYIISQIVGAILGFGLIVLVTPSDIMKSQEPVTIQMGNITKTVKPLGACSPGFNPKISPFQGFLVEFAISFILSWVCCGIWDRRNTRKTDSVPIRFGLAVAGLAMAAGAYTGAHMNPARSLGPALWNNDWEYHWMFWVAPILAAIIASLFYRLVFVRNIEEESDDYCCNCP